MVLFPHLIPHHWSAQDAENIRRWNPKVVKVVWSGVPPYLDQMPKDSVIVVRDHPLSENWERRGFVDVSDARRKGEGHADEAKKIADGIKERYGIPVERLKFEGLNEPRLWADEPPALTAEYYAAFLRRLHQHGLNGVVLNFSVGWPGNAGTDSPPIWEPFRPVLNEMCPRDWLGLHEYWGLSGPQDGYLWLACRYLQCSWEVPILIGEAGIDQAVMSGVHLGWRGLLGNSEEERARRYLEQLRWYAAQLQADKRVVGVCVFTYDLGSKDWETFDIRSEVLLRGLREMPKENVWGGSTVWRWRPLIEKWAANYDVDPKVVATVIHVESRGDPHAVSSAGAVGLMQVMPGEKIPGRPRSELLKNPDLNVKTGVSILNTTLAYFNGELARALAAYYMGIGGLEKQGLDSQPAREYLGAFVEAWRLLWPGVACPVRVGRDVTSARWHAEEAVREVERVLARLNDAVGQIDASLRELQVVRTEALSARQRLIEQTIPTLYDIELGRQR